MHVRKYSQTVPHVIHFEPLANLALIERAMGRNRKQLCTNFPLILVVTLWEKPRGKVNVWDISLTMKPSNTNFAYFCL